MATYLQYLGPKDQKQVIFVPSRPVFNKANNFTCAMPEQDAANILAATGKEVVAGGHPLFRVVDDMKQKRPKEVEGAAEEASLPKRRRTEPEPYGGVDEETTPPNQPPKPEDRGRQLFGKSDGSPYASAGAAKMQLPRFAKRKGMEEDALEVVALDDGFYIALAESEE